jgi:hypothetical protein
MRGRSSPHRLVGRDEHLDVVACGVKQLVKSALDRLGKWHLARHDSLGGQAAGGNQSDHAGPAGHREAVDPFQRHVPERQPGRIDLDRFGMERCLNDGGSGPDGVDARLQGGRVSGALDGNVDAIREILT